MKDIVKKLQWKGSKAVGTNCSYSIYETNYNSYRCIAYNKALDRTDVGIVDNWHAAKAICQAHYEQMVLSEFSNDNLFKIKNIVKPLQWEEINKKYSLWTAKFPGIPFFSYKTLWFMDEFRCCFEHNVHDVNNKLWEEIGFLTIEEAKAACHKHYEEFVLSLLSEEATQTLLKHDF